MECAVPRYKLRLKWHPWIVRLKQARLISVNQTVPYVPTNRPTAAAAAQSSAQTAKHGRPVLHKKAPANALLVRTDRDAKSEGHKEIVWAEDPATEVRAVMIGQLSSRSARVNRRSCGLVVPSYLMDWWTFAWWWQSCCMLSESEHAAVVPYIYLNVLLYTAVPVR